MSVQRAALLSTAVRLEVMTVAWMAVEAVLAIGAGVLARSALLTAFGLDSVIELLSGGVLLWRLVSEASGADGARVERVERRARWLASVLLVLLCLYVVATVALGLIARVEPEGSP